MADITSTDSVNIIVHYDGTDTWPDCLDYYWIVKWSGGTEKFQVRDADGYGSDIEVVGDIAHDQPLAIYNKSAAALVYLVDFCGGNWYAPTTVASIDEYGKGLFGAAGINLEVHSTLPASPPDGTMVLFDDGTNKRIYFRLNGVWKYAALTAV